MNIEEQNVTVDAIRSTLALALQVPLEAILPDLSFGDLPQWDSMGHMEVMMRLEEHFGVEITAETIGALTSIPAIQKHLLDTQTKG